MKRSIIIFIILISFIGGVIWYGKSLPELSHVSTTQTFNRPSEYIWQLIFDFRRYPEWRENVYAVEKTPSTSKYANWKEIDEDGITTPFQLVNFNQNTFISMEETGEKIQKSGKWHFSLSASEDGKSSTLTITEDRIIPSLVPRVLNHLLNTGSEHIDAYFRSINNKITRDRIRAKKNRNRLPIKRQVPKKSEKRHKDKT